MISNNKAESMIERLSTRTEPFSSTQKDTNFGCSQSVLLSLCTKKMVLILISPRLLVLSSLTFLLVQSAPEQLRRQQHVADADALVHLVNSARNAGWTAKAHARFAQMTEQDFQRLLGVKGSPHSGEFEEHKTIMELRKKSGVKTAARSSDSIKTEDKLPRHFDARKQWPQCADVIGLIQDQSHCGSCWAVSAASVMQDRICLESNGAQKVNISALDVLSCTRGNSEGCNGGESSDAFMHWAQQGFCTGSEYVDKMGCKPYPFPPRSKIDYDTPACKHTCENADYNKEYEEDKHYGMSVTNWRFSDPTDMMREIMTNGPLETHITVYQDFRFYSSGVYRHTFGKALGGHAVRVIGWGVDGPTKMPYWLVANSWGADWGEHGYFRIRRGTDECFCESWSVNFAKPIVE